MIKRMFVLLVLVLALTACGVGGTDAPTTAPTTQAAAAPTKAPTKEAEPTKKPEPTEKPEPTKKPEASGEFDSEIPIPAGSELYQQGDDPQIDEFVEAFLKSAGESSNGMVTPENMEFYLTDESVEDTAAFFETEMVDQGWTLDQNEATPETTSLFFLSPDQQTYVGISITDLAKAPGSNLDQVIIGVISVTKESGAIEPDSPSTGDDPFAGFDFDVPAPPDSEPYELGGDPKIDAGLEQMDKEISEEAASEDAIYNGLTFYKTTATAEDIIKFYDEEMTALGWEGDTPNEEEYGTMLLYKDPEIERLVMISIVDLKALQNIETDDLFVFTTVILPAGEETPGTNPTSGNTSEPSDSTGSSGPIDIAKVSPPPGATEIKEGDDPNYDLLIQTMSSGGTGDTIFYLTDATLEELTEFYEKDLSGMGLEAAPATDTSQTSSITLLYWDKDYNSVMVMAFEGSQFMAEKNIVMIMDMQ